MTIYLPDLYERPVPRYTSYPTALEFHDGISAAEHAEALAAVPEDMPVSLYVHIPYCREICWYCGCNTGAIGKPDRIGSYVGALYAEVAAVARLMRGRVVSIHFGGGSPNALPADVLVALIACLKTAFATVSKLEIAVELDPRLADAAYARAMAAAGITRTSLGVQCFAPHVQAAINRVQPAVVVERVVRELRGVGVQAINFDLLHGLPTQTLADIVDTIDRSIAMRPDRVALFGYAHHPQRLPRQRMIDTGTLPNSVERFEQGCVAHDRLVAAGYQSIGFDHFALPEDPLARSAREGRLRRNFQGFTDEKGEAVIGIGASAISQFSSLITQNEKHVGLYRSMALGGNLATVRGVARSADDRMRGEAIERLLCDRRVDLPAVAERHGRCPNGFLAAHDRLRALSERNLVDVDGGVISIWAEAMPYARVIASAFDRYR